ncbi:Cytochrome P450 52A6 [Yarrowia sp. C11]|nr:Cytochrome P450 52A6 [Yarrowia sp. E02]KAG5373413.1 Cytochrome P450 52A6 [Yarrowia sp. C11]
MIIPFLLTLLAVYWIHKRITYYQHKNAAYKKWISSGKFMEGQKVADIEVDNNFFLNPFGLVQFVEFLQRAKGHHFVDFVNENFRKYGPVLKTSTFGRHNVITCDPELIKTVLATNFKDWSIGLRRQAMFPVLGNAIFSVEGDQWTHSRAMLRPQFARDSISNIDDLECHVKRLIDVFRRYQGSTFDCQKYFFQFTLDSASDFLFGESTSSLIADNDDDDNLLTQQGEDAESFAQAFKLAFTFTAIRLRLQQFYWLLTPSNSKYKDSIATVHRLVDGYVERALENQEKTDRYIISNQLVKVCDDKKYIRDQLLGILLAGRNTTAAVLAWILYECGRKPEIWQKMKQEVEDMFPGGCKVTSEEIRRCSYVRAVINEALRVYPSVPMNQRVATRDTFLPSGGGPDKSLPLYCPRGTKLAYSVFALHMREDFYGADSAVFRPERWNEGVGKGWQYLPFNGGPRICLGQQFALMEASYTLVRLVQEFETVELDMEVVDPPPKVSSFSMVHKDGVKVRMR